MNKFLIILLFLAIIIFSGCINLNKNVIPVNYIDFNKQYIEKYQQSANGFFTIINTGELVYFDNNLNSELNISWFTPSMINNNENSRWLTIGDKLEINSRRIS